MIPSYSWLYTAFIGIDANFRMKRKKISNERFDPSLTNGYGYFVEQAGYQDHLVRNTGQKQEVIGYVFLWVPLLMNILA